MEIAQAVKEVFEGALMLQLYPRCVAPGPEPSTAPVSGTVDEAVRRRHRRREPECRLAV